MNRDTDDPPSVDAASAMCCEAGICEIPGPRLAAAGRAGPGEDRECDGPERRAPD